MIVNRKELLEKLNNIYDKNILNEVIFKIENDTLYILNIINEKLIFTNIEIKDNKATLTIKINIEKLINFLENSDSKTVKFQFKYSNMICKTGNYSVLHEITPYVLPEEYVSILKLNITKNNPTNSLPILELTKHIDFNTDYENIKINKYIRLVCSSQHKKTKLELTDNKVISVFVNSDTSIVTDIDAFIKISDIYELQHIFNNNMNYYYNLNNKIILHTNNGIKIALPYLYKPEIKSLGSIIASKSTNIETMNVNITKFKNIINILNNLLIDNPRLVTLMTNKSKYEFKVNDDSLKINELENVININTSLTPEIISKLNLILNNIAINNFHDSPLKISINSDFILLKYSTFNAIISL